MNKLWNQIEGFNENEPWGQPEKMNGLAVMLLAHIRQWFRNKHGESVTIVLHCGYEETGHASDSQHAWKLRDHKSRMVGGTIGNAEDFHFKGLDHLTFSQQASEMLECLGDLQVLSVVGLGIYPTWNTKGFHVDVRGYPARWGFVNGKAVKIGEALAYAVGQEGGV